MKHRIIYRTIFCLISLALLLIGITASAEETPVIFLLQNPALGQEEDVVGAIRNQDGTICDDYTGWRITMYIQLQDGQQYWIKPGTTDESGHFETLIPDEEGYFSGAYYSYGDSLENDLNAKYIHVLLIPASFDPKINGYADAVSAAADHVVITRTDSVLVTPERVLPEDHTRTANLPVRASKIAVDLGFYTSGSSGSEVSLEKMRSELNAISPFADTVRFYSSSGTAYKAYSLAHSMGFKVIGTAWITGDKSKDQKELDALIEHANNGLISMAVVGNETQLDGSISLDELICDINYVRSQIPESIPVTTSETLGIVAKSPRLRRACDVLFVNVYPFLEKSTIEDASKRISKQLSNLRAVGNGKQVIVSETGWPSAGRSDATETNAARYFEELRAWSLSSGINVIYFEAFDEQWKASAKGEDYEAHWGFMDSKLQLKEGYRLTTFFKNIGLGVEAVSIPDHVKEIKNETFANCTSMQYLYLSDEIEKIADDAFVGCSNLTLIVPEGSYAYSWAVEHGFTIILW